MAHTSASDGAEHYALRRRNAQTASGIPAGPAQNGSAPKLSVQRQRIADFQRRFETIKGDLPPQLTRRHIGMISIGGVIGTGLFVGSGNALKDGGPVGALIAYVLMGSVVYCLCVSVGEMISFLPNVGGVVGLADLYVDEALGFSLGWAAWYNWSITLPVEITAAIAVIRYWQPHIQYIQTRWLITLFLFAALIINCFPSRVYGRLEFGLSLLKVTLMMFVVIGAFAVDAGANKNSTPHYFGTWKTPFSPCGYKGIQHSEGQFLGFWSALMQAGFSFFGSEVPGIAAGEVIDATINVPRALKRVWARIMLFYVMGIFAAGLVYPQLFLSKDDHGHLTTVTCQANDTTSMDQNTHNSTGSPFVEIFRDAGVSLLPDIVNGAILISALSAAASDLYISSRFLFFLARRHHAPSWLAYLVRYPLPPVKADSPPEPSGDEQELLEYFDHPDPVTVTTRPVDNVNEVEFGRTPPPNSLAKFKFVIPIASVIVSASLGTLAYMTIDDHSDANKAFRWMSDVTSIASLQSWIGILFTYYRWYQGTVYAEKHGSDENKEGVKRIKEHRAWGQPYARNVPISPQESPDSFSQLAYYALTVCVLILLTNGWHVFLSSDWRIADLDPSTVNLDLTSDIVPLFLSAYVTLPIFVVMTVGYKIMFQTKMITLDEMEFIDANLQLNTALTSTPKSFLQRIWYWII